MITFCSIFADEFSREPVSGAPSPDDDEQPIDPISDIGINKINEIMFNNFKWYPATATATATGSHFEIIVSSSYLDSV